MEEETNSKINTLKDALNLKVCVITESGCLYHEGKKVGAKELKTNYSAINYRDGYDALLITPTSDEYGQHGIKIYTLVPHDNESANPVRYGMSIKKDYQWEEDGSFCSFSVFPSGKFVMDRVGSFYIKKFVSGQICDVRTEHLPYLTSGYSTLVHDIRIRHCVHRTRGLFSKETQKIIADAGFAFHDETGESAPKDVCQLLYAIKHPTASHRGLSRENALKARLNGKYEMIESSREPLVVDCGKWVALVFVSNYRAYSIKVCIQYKKSTGEQRTNIFPVSFGCPWLNERSIFDIEKTISAMTDNSELIHAIAHAVSQPEAIAALSQVSHLSFVFKAALPLFSDDAWEKLSRITTEAESALDEYVKTHDCPVHHVRKRIHHEEVDGSDTFKLVKETVGAGLKCLMRSYYMDMTYEATIGKVLPEFEEQLPKVAKAGISEEPEARIGSDSSYVYEAFNAQIFNWKPSTLITADLLSVTKTVDLSKRKPWQQCGIGKEMYYSILSSKLDINKHSYFPKEVCAYTIRKAIKTVFGLGYRNRASDVIFQHYGSLFTPQMIDDFVWLDAANSNYGEINLIDDPLLESMRSIFEKLDNSMPYRWITEASYAQALFNDISDNKFVEFLNREVTLIKHMRSSNLFKGTTAEEASLIMRLTQDYTQIVERLVRYHVEGSDFKWPKVSEISGLNELHHLHDEANRLLLEASSQSARAEADEKNFLWDDLRKKICKDIEFSDDKTPFAIKLPSKLSELIVEGLALSHCVGSYVDSVVNGRDVIAFIRRKDAADTPLLTVDLALGDDKKYKIRQVHGLRNSEPTSVPQAMNFLKDWVAAREKIDAATVSENYGALCHR